VFKPFKKLKAPFKINLTYSNSSSPIYEIKENYYYSEEYILYLLNFFIIILPNDFLEKKSTFYKCFETVCK